MDNTTATNVGLFIIRLALGIIFIVHGVQKLVGFAGTTDFLGSLGFPVPVVFAVVLTAVELLGGIAVLVGIYTRFAASLLALVMVVALILVKGSQGFSAAQADIMLLGSALGLAFIGPGGLRIGFTDSLSKSEQNSGSAGPGRAYDRGEASQAEPAAAQNKSESGDDA